LINEAVYFSFCVLIKFSNIYIKGVINMNKVASAKKRVPAKGPALKKAASKKMVVKKTTLKKAAVKKSLVKKAVAKKTPESKAAQNKIASKKAIQKRTASKVSTTKKTAAPKKTATRIVQKKAAPPKKAAPQRVIKKTVPKARPKKTVAMTQIPKLKPRREKLNKTAEVKNVSLKKTALKPPVTKHAEIAAKKSLSRKKSPKKPAVDVIHAQAGIMRAVTPSTEKMVPEKHVSPIKTAKVHSLRAVLARLSRVQKPVINRTADNIASLARTPLPNVHGATLPFMKKIRHT